MRMSINILNFVGFFELLKYPPKRILQRNYPVQITSSREASQLIRLQQFDNRAPLPLP